MKGSRTQIFLTPLHFSKTGGAGRLSGTEKENPVLDEAHDKGPDQELPTHFFCYNSNKALKTLSRGG